MHRRHHRHQVLLAQPKPSKPERLPARLAVEGCAVPGTVVVGLLPVIVLVRLLRRNGWDSVADTMS